ncbi:hypothetical protein L579_2704 [Pantoea sp. AS-PWVM4]|uniref:hypothetical protein n=1 Tax=Pantoea sp. AS-PWVM4 TaxID=1332069 RepID=UPI0003AC7E43|nr:hypothetical protein [Pantoea sp. AS-PWVM4]ERK17750.1 hypothetical protein L579_2704 [Pantoea sp. AS-PWVM4]
MIDTQSATQKPINRPSGADLENGRINYSWGNCLSDIATSLVRPVSDACSLISLPRSACDLGLSMLNNITYFLAHPAFLSSSTTAPVPGAIIGVGANVLASGLHRTKIRDVQSFIDRLPALYRYCLKDRKKLIGTLERIMDGLQPPEERVANCGGKPCGEDGRNDSQQFERHKNNIKSLIRFLLYPEFELLELVDRVFSLSDTPQKTVSVDEVAFRARNALDVLKERKEWVEKFLSYVTALNKLPLRSELIHSQRQMKNERELAASKEAWNAFTTEWFRLAEVLRNILLGLTDLRTHSNPLLPLLKDALPLTSNATGNVWEQLLQDNCGKPALHTSQYLFASDKNHKPVKDDIFPEFDPTPEPKRAAIQRKPEQEASTRQDGVSLSLLIQSLTDSISTTFRGIENINLFPLFLPLVEGAGKESDLLTTQTPDDIWRQHPELLPDRSNTTTTGETTPLLRRLNNQLSISVNGSLTETSTEEKIKSIIWQDFLAAPPVTKMYEYDLLYKHSENMRMLSLQDNIINSEDVTVENLLNAYAGICNNAPAPGLTDVNPYEFSLFVRTLVRGGDFAVSPEQLMTKMLSLPDKKEWLASLFFSSLIKVDKDIITYAMDSFYQRIKGDVKISDLHSIKEAVLSSLPASKSSPSAGDNNAIKHSRHQNEQAEKFRRLSRTQLAAIRQIIDHKIADLFPLANVNLTQGGQTENHPYLNYRVLSLEGIMLNFGAACAKTYDLSLSVNENPVQLQFIALLTLLHADPEFMPPDSKDYFKLYDEEQVTTSAVTENNIKINEITSSFRGLGKLLKDLKQVYHLSNKLFSAHLDFAVAMKASDESNNDAEKLTLIKEKFSSEFAETCEHILSSLPMEAKNYIEKAVSAGTLRVKVNRLIISVNGNKNNVPLNAGTIITVQNLEGIITRAYLLSPSMMITDMVNSGICEIPVSSLEIKDISKYVEQHSLFFINKFIPHRMHKNKAEDYKFAIPQVKLIKPLSIAGSNWTSQVSNFTAENIHVVYQAVQEELPEILPQAEEFKWFNIQPEVAPLFPLLPQDGKYEENNDEALKKLDNLLNQLLGFIPFGSCVSSVADLIKITELAKEEPQKKTILINKVETFKVVQNGTGKALLETMSKPDAGPLRIQERTSSTNEELDEAKVALANDGIGCIADFMSLGTEKAVQDLQQIAEKALKRIVLKHDLHQENGPRKVNEFTPFKNHKENTWGNKLKQHEALAPFVKDVSPDKKPQTDTFNLDNMPQDHIYSGVIYNAPDESLTIVFKVGNDERMYSVEGAGNALVRKSDSYQLRYWREKISGKQLDNIAAKFLAGHVKKEDLKQAAKEEIQWNHLDGYAVPEGAFGTAFSQVEKLDNSLDIYYDKKSKDYFLNRNDGYIRLEKNSQENIFNAVGESAPRDLNVQIKLEQDGSYRVVNDSRIKVRTIDAALHALKKTHQGKPIFNNDIFLAMIGPDETLTMTQTHVLLSPYQYGDLSENAVRFIQVLEDKNGGLHYRIGPTEEGRFVPLDAEQSASVGKFCRVKKRAGTRKERCVQTQIGQKTLSSDTAQRVKELDDLYQARDEYRNSESETFKILQSYQRIDELKSEINIDEDIKSLIDKHRDLEGAGVVENWSDNDFFSSIVDAGEYFLIIGNNFWKKVVKKSHANEKELAEKISDITQTLIDAKANNKEHDFVSRRKEYKDKYLKTENEIWDKALSEVNARGADYKIDGKQIVHNENTNSLYKKLGRASDETFSSEYPVIKTIIDDGVKKTREIAKDALANGKSEQDFWRYFTELTGIDSRDLSQEMRIDIEDKFYGITQLSSELTLEDIEVLEEFSVLTSHHLHEKSTNPLRKEMEIFGSHIHGFVEGGDYPIHIAVNSIKLKELPETIIHETGHLQGDEFFDKEIYTDLETNIASDRKQNLPALVKILCHSPLALAKYLKSIGESVGIVFQKVGRSVLEELNYRNSELADLVGYGADENLAQINEHASRITELEKALNDLAKVVRSHDFNHESIDKLVGFISEAGNAQHRAAGLIMHPDIFPAMVQYIAAPARVKRSVETDSSQDNDATLFSKMVTVGLAKRVFTTQPQPRNLTHGEALLSVNFFTSPSSETSTVTAQA